MEGSPDIEQIRACVERRDWGRLRGAAAAVPPADLADLIADLGAAERVLAFRALARTVAARVFAELTVAERDTLVAELADVRAYGLMATLPADDRAALLGELPSQVVRRLLALASPADLASMRELLGFPESSVGRLLLPAPLAVDPELLVDEASTFLRRLDPEDATLDRLFVVDRAGELIAEVPLRLLLFAPPETPVHRIADLAVISVPAETAQEEALRQMDEYGLATLPVVDDAGHLLGVVTRSALSASVAAATDGRASGTARGGAAGTAHPLAAAVREVVAPRLPGLLVTLAGGLAAAAVMGVFGGLLGSVVALAFFVPLVLAAGRALGAHASTRPAPGSSLLHEAVAGLAGGAVVGVPAALVALLWLRSAPLALTVLAALVGVGGVAALIDAGAPRLMDRLGMEDAAAAPLLDAFRAVTALLLYFLLASWLLG